MKRNPRPTIAFFPEASFGAALNCVAIAQALQAKGARPVFICHSGFSGVFSGYGFLEIPLNTQGFMSESQKQSYWQAFVQRHLPHFNLSPFEQLETYVAPTWNAIVDTVMNAEAPLAELLARLKPDAIVLDNVAMFPAISQAGCPWVRVISCAETELPDALVPPYLSGLPADASAQRGAFEKRYLAAVAPAHQRMNKFRVAKGMKPLLPGTFLEPSPVLNLLLTPAIVRRKRKMRLDSKSHVYLEACVRSEAPYDVPALPRNVGPLVYVSFGSLGAMDVGLIERMIAVFAKLPARFLVNGGSLANAYRSVPDNVHLDSWYPQPSLLAKADLFIHHGGNNSFCEALHFAVPSLIMPYCWDGHDNACRAVEAGVGLALHRANWTDAEFTGTFERLLADKGMKAHLTANAKEMAKSPGAQKAANAILNLF